MRRFALGIVCFLALVAPAVAGSFGGPPVPDRAAGPGGLTAVDWQDPAMLPARFRNHCTVENWSGRSYCADHCGRGYQFYYCSRDSFGCCAVGYGYCDDRGHLRCHP